MLQLTEAEMAVAFNEWLTRYNSDPEEFAEEYGEVGDYGDDCAAYFTKLITELRQA